MVELTLSDLLPALFAAIIPLLIGVWVFIDAKKNTISKPILWALGVFLLLIIVLPIYLFVRWRKGR